MTTQMIIAQCLMVMTLIIMITGKTPLYLTAIVGAAVSAIVAGYPLTVKITFATLSVLHGVVKHAIFAGVYR